MQLKVVEDVVKVKEKKKDPITPNQNSNKSKKTPASHTGS